MNAQTPWIIRNAFKCPELATEHSAMIGEHMKKAAWAEDNRSAMPKSAKPDGATEREARIEALLWRHIMAEGQVTATRLNSLTAKGESPIREALARMVTDGRVVKTLKPCPNVKNHRIVAFFSIAGAN